MVSRLPCWSLIHERSYSAVGRSDGRRPGQCRKGLTVLVWCGATLSEGKAGSPRPSTPCSSYRTVSRGRNLNYCGEQGRLPALGWAGTAGARASSQPGQGTWGRFLCGKVQETWEGGKVKELGFFNPGEDRKDQVRVLKVDGLGFKYWGVGSSRWTEVSHWAVPYHQKRRRGWGRSAAAPGSAVTGDEWDLPSKQNAPLLCRACSPRPHFQNPQLSRPAAQQASFNLRSSAEFEYTAASGVTVVLSGCEFSFFFNSRPLEWLHLPFCPLVSTNQMSV